MSIWFCRVLWLTALLVPAFPSLAGEPVSERTSHAALLPDDIEVYAELNGATREEWRFVASLAGPGVSLDDSWHELADAVGLDEAEAFERLLGNRVSIALRGVWGDDPDWAALWTTDNATAELIRKRLRARPRRIIGGQAVLRLPGGRFELTEFHADTGVTVMMAPTRELGGVLSDSCAAPKVTLASTERVRAFDSMHEHGPHFIAAALPQQKGWLSAGAEVRSRAVTLGLAGRFAEWGEPRPVFDPGAWEDLFDGALLGVVERGRAIFEEGIFEDVAALEPFARSMGPSAGEVIVALVRETDGGVEIGGAVSVAGPESRAEKLDAGAARSLAVLGPPVGHEVYDFRGAAPRAMRAAVLSDSLQVSWRYLGDGWQPGWVVGGTSEAVVAALSEKATGEAHRMRFRVTLDGEGGESLPMAAWRSVGVARPRALLSDGAGDGALAGLAGIEFLRWRIRDLPSGRVDGELVLERAE